MLYFSNDTCVNFKDYMFEYLTKVEKREGYTFNPEIKFEEKEAMINKAILADIERVAGVSLNMEGITPEVMANHPNIRFASFAVVGQLIDTIVPDVIDRSIGVYTETRYGQFGDSFRFDVEPNDLFFVSKAGRDQRTVDFQRQYTGTQYIVPENRAITVYVNLFRVLCGLDSLGKFVMKAILSVEAKITQEVYAAISTAVDALPTTPVGGELKITAAGGVVNKQAAIQLAQRVSAFNGGATPMFVGTRVALSYLFPEAESGYRYLDAGLVYHRTVWGVDTLELRQVADWQNKYKTLLDDTKIFVLCPTAQKIVKLCYEGATMTNSLSADETANKLQVTTMNKSYGIGIATNAIAGLIVIGA